MTSTASRFIPPRALWLVAAHYSAVTEPYNRPLGAPIGWRRSPSEQARSHRRGRAWPVVPLALEKRLFLNVRRKYLLVTLLGKKPCDINKRLASERFRSAPRTR